MIKRKILLAAMTAMIALTPHTVHADVTCRELVQSYVEANQRELTISEICAIVGEKYGICPELLESLIEQESNGNPKAYADGCIGLCQINTKWHQERMSRLRVRDIWDPYSNILVAGDYLAELVQEGIRTGRGDDIAYALMRYNMKTETANRMWDSGEVSDYALKIIERSSELERRNGK